MRWTGHMDKMGRARIAFKISTGSSTGRLPFERLRVDGMEFQEMGVNTRN